MSSRPKEVPACSVCHAPDASLWAELPDTDGVTGQTFAVWRCARCGSGFVHPHPKAGVLARLYGDEFFSRRKRKGLLASAFGRIEPWFIDRRATAVERAVGRRSGRVLDVGCGNGMFLAAMRRRGWTVHGIEPSPAGAERARVDHGLEITCADPCAAALEADAYDVITLWHVLEHVPDPAATLRHLVAALRPDGHLIVAVPNFAGIEARMLGRRWAFLDVPRHLTAFTPMSLQHVATAAGLESTPVRVHLLEYAVPISILNVAALASGSDPLFLYRWVKRQHDYGDSLLPALRLLLIVFVVACSLPFTIPASLIAEWAGRGNGWIGVFRRGTAT